jgi:hypothetical protein
MLRRIDVGRSIEHASIVPTAERAAKHVTALFNATLVVP